MSRDPRFVLDDVPFERMIRQALPLAGTRDPLDRILAAHSTARRVPLCSLYRRMRREHPLLVEELR